MKVTIEGSWGEIACLLRSLNGEDLDDLDAGLPHPDNEAPPPRPTEPEPYTPPPAPPAVVRPGDMLARAIGMPSSTSSPSSSIEAAAERRRRMAGVVLPPEDDAETAEGTDQPEKF